MSSLHSLIVGGTRGVGRVLAKAFANENHVVTVLGKRPPSDNDIVSVNVNYHICDIRNDIDHLKLITSIVETRGPLNHIIFCQRFKGQEENWTGELATSLTSTKKIIEAAEDKFSSTGEKAIVILSSITSQFIADEQQVGYHVAKAGLESLVRYYALLLGPKNIRVNGVSPAMFIKDESKEYYSQNKSLADQYSRVIPLGRMGTAEEIAHVIRFLCSSQASYVTGQNIIVDGGISIQSQASIARKLWSGAK